MGLLDYFQPKPPASIFNYIKPAPQPWRAPMLPPAPAPRPAPRVVYTAPRVSYTPRAVAAPIARPVAAPRAPAGDGGYAKQVAAQNAANKRAEDRQDAAQAKAEANQKRLEAKADAAQKKADKEATDRSRRENQATKALVNQQVKLSGAFGKQRDTKLRNISSTYTASDRNLRKGYGQALGGLYSTVKDNDKSEAGSTFQNVANAVRERRDIIGEVSNNGAGETDVLRGQLAALRNYSNNQNEINRSFFDTLNSINRSITSLNVDTTTSRNGLWSQAESDRESAWANYYNQQSDTWTQISNIENSNNNVKSSTSEAYKKTQTDAGNKAASYAGSSYAKKNNTKLDTWGGKGNTVKRKLTSANAAATVNLGGPMKRAEGATLRKW